MEIYRKIGWCVRVCFLCVWVFLLFPYGWIRYALSANVNQSTENDVGNRPKCKPFETVGFGLVAFGRIVRRVAAKTLLNAACCLGNTRTLQYPCVYFSFLFHLTWFVCANANDNYISATQQHLSRYFMQWPFIGLKLLCCFTFIFFSLFRLSFLLLFGYCHHFFVRILFVILFLFSRLILCCSLRSLRSIAIYLHCAVFACTQTETMFSWFVSWFVSHLLLSDGFLSICSFLSILVFTPNRNSFRTQTQTLAHKRAKYSIHLVWYVLSLLPFQLFNYWWCCRCVCPKMSEPARQFNQMIMAIPTKFWVFSMRNNEQTDPDR